MGGLFDDDVHAYKESAKALHRTLNPDRVDERRPVYGTMEHQSDEHPMERYTEASPSRSSPVVRLRLDASRAYVIRALGSRQEDSGICRKHHRIVCCQIPYRASRAVRES
ncbi:hypothetical protein Scel_82360 [Streptomyces cellostaticus]|nr:hypothetical protein Scel_82360 [Streptomyces cellostaticus]